MQKNCWLLALFLLLSGAARAQAPLLRSLSLTFDTTQYRLGEQMIPVAGEERLYFYYHQDDQAAELRLTPTQPGRPPRLLPSADYVLQDTLVAGANGEYRGTLRFRNLTGTPFVRLTFVQPGAPVGAPADSAGRAALRATMRQQVVSLLPLTRTTLDARVADNELFVGEERVIELNTNNVANVRASNEWTKGQDIDYRLAREQNGLRLHVVPNTLGVHTLTLKTLVERPYLDANNHLSYQLPPLRIDFAVKSSRLRFLTAERKDVNYDDEGRTRGIEFVLDDGHSFELHRT